MYFIVAWNYPIDPVSWLSRDEDCDEPPFAFRTIMYIKESESFMYIEESKPSFQRPMDQHVWWNVYVLEVWEIKDEALT